MNRLSRDWDRIFFSRFDPHAVALFRISIGLLWLLVLLFMTPNWHRFFGADGLPGAVDPTLWHDPWSVFACTDGWLPVSFWWVFGVVTAVLFVIGLATRCMAVCVWVLLGSMIHRNLMLTNGEDVTLHMAFWWALFMPLGHELSVDEYLRLRRLTARGQLDARPMPMIWSTRMLQLSIAGIYVFSLPRKLAGDVAWWNGDAFFFAIVNGHWSKWPWKELFYHHWLSAMATYGAIVAEGTFPIIVWFRRTRVSAVIVMSCFHVMIALMLDNVAFFSLSMVTMYWVFIPGETSRRWMEKAATIVKRMRLASKLFDREPHAISANTTD